MEPRVANQSGYLLVFAIIMIVVVGIIGAILVNMFVKNSKADAEVSQSNQAAFIAESGIEMAKHDIIKQIQSCSGINGLSKFTNASRFNGELLATGSSNVADTTLAANIVAGTTSLNLADASTFAASGTIKVGGEVIGYLSKTGNTLNDLLRGRAGTTAAAHSSGNSVNQTQCVITAIGGVPNVAGAMSTKRIINQVLSGSVLSVNGKSPVLGTAQDVTLNGGAKVTNPKVIINEQDYPGCNIVSRLNVSIVGGSVTEVDNGSGTLITSSDSSTQLADIQIDPTINAGTLFEKYFGTTSAIISASADHSYNVGNIDGVTNKTIWIDGGLTFVGGGTVNIGTAAQPVILIVNGNLSSLGNVTINFYGFIFAFGTIDLGGAGGFNGEGAMAATGAITLNGNKTVTFNTGILSKLIQLNSHLKPSYISQPVSFTEMFA